MFDERKGCQSGRKLELTFVAEKPPPWRVLTEIAMTAAEAGAAGRLSSQLSSSC